MAAIIPCDEMIFEHPAFGTQYCSSTCHPSRTKELQIEFCRNNCPEYYWNCRSDLENLIPPWAIAVGCCCLLVFLIILAIVLIRRNGGRINKQLFQKKTTKYSVQEVDDAKAQSLQGCAETKPLTTVDSGHSDDRCTVNVD